jgi:hypothetical protein
VVCERRTHPPAGLRLDPKVDLAEEARVELVDRREQRQPA